MILIKGFWALWVYRQALIRFRPPCLGWAGWREPRRLCGAYSSFVLTPASEPDREGANLGLGVLGFRGRVVLLQEAWV